MTNHTIHGIHYESGKKVSIKTDQGLIMEISKYSGPEEINLFVAPGLIDNQVNGYAGIDFSGNDLTPFAVIKATHALLQEGVTSYFPTLLTNSHKNLKRNFRVLAEALKDESVRKSIPGFHLEGPYISPLDGFRGCHPSKYVRKPSWEEFLAYQEAADGNILQVTIAPEIEGAPEFIRKCVKSGVIVALGHTNADSLQISEATDCGARLSTHLGNGCANFIHRHNNPIWPQLSNDLLTISVIADGHHLLKDEINVFYKVKRERKIILTSDVVYLAGMPAGKYRFMESDVILTVEGMLINPELNCLAGASIPLIRGVENIIGFTKCSLGSAINLASDNVAEFYNLTDRGKLTEGRRADLILFEKKGNNLFLKETIVAGEKVF